MRRGTRINGELEKTGNYEIHERRERGEESYIKTGRMGRGGAAGFLDSGGLARIIGSLLSRRRITGINWVKQR